MVGPPAQGLAAVNLANVINGSYPIWSELRFVTTNTTAQGYASNLATWAQQLNTLPGGSQPDFVNANSLNVEHAHFALASYGVVNDAYTASEGPRVCGTSSGSVQAGGDAGGIVHSLQAGADYAVLYYNAHGTGNYGTASCVGITNTASFGTHQ